MFTPVSVLPDLLRRLDLFRLHESFLLSHLHVELLYYLYDCRDAGSVCVVVLV
jgi:hypothetical protein